MSECVVLANCLLEIGCLVKIVDTLTGQKGKRGNKLQYAIVAIILGISVYINFYNGNSWLQMIYYVGLLGIFKVRYGMNIIDTVTYFILSFLVVGALEFLVYVPYNFLYYLLQGTGDFSILIILTVFLICCLLEKKEIMSWREGVYLSVALFIFLVFIYKLSAYQIEMDYHKRYAHKYGEVITELRERQHKFVNQMDSVYALCKIYDNYNELVKHQTAELESLRRYLMPGKLLILERPLVVAHMYTKLSEAEEKGIGIHTDFSCSLENIDIPDIFLIEIIGNLLDNAMDEVSARGKHEKIRIVIMDDSDEVCMSVGNEHEKIPYKEYSQFFQIGYSAKGSDHGVGLPYVKKIVDKFHGRIEIGNIMYGADNYFVISVYFKS